MACKKLDGMRFRVYECSKHIDNEHLYHHHDTGKEFTIESADINDCMNRGFSDPQYVVGMTMLKKSYGFTNPTFTNGWFVQWKEILMKGYLPYRGANYWYIERIV